MNTKSLFFVFLLIAFSGRAFTQVLNLGLELDYYADQYMYVNPRTIYTSFNNDQQFTVGNFSNPQKPFTFPGLAVQYDLKNNWFFKYSLTYTRQENIFSSAL